MLAYELSICIARQTEAAVLALIVHVENEVESCKLEPAPAVPWAMRTDAADASKALQSLALFMTSLHCVNIFSCSPDNASVVERFTLGVSAMTGRQTIVEIKQCLPVSLYPVLPELMRQPRPGTHVALTGCLYGCRGSAVRLSVHRGKAPGNASSSGEFEPRQRQHLSQLQAQQQKQPQPSRMPSHDTILTRARLRRGSHLLRVRALLYVTPDKCSSTESLLGQAGSS